MLLCNLGWARPTPTRQVVLPALDTSELRQGARDERVGIRRPLRLHPEDGLWSTDARGRRMWSVEMRSPGATGLRLHFEEFAAGSGQVWIYDPAAPSRRFFGPYSGAGPAGRGSFWTETLFTSDVGIAFEPAPGAPDTTPFRVSELFHWWRDLPQFTLTGNYSCFKDVNCYWGMSAVQQAAQSSVFLITDKGSCSGTLIRDQRGTGTPFLLTAGHCLSAQSDADFLDVFFGYRTSQCADASGGGFGTLGDLEPFNFPQVVGSTLLSESYLSGGSNLINPSQPDYSFVLLSGVPNASLQFSTVNPNGKPGDTFFSVSDPKSLPQAYATGRINNYIDGLDFFSTQMSQGQTDFGSSGSGIFDDQGELLGVASFLVSTTQETSIEYACDLTGPQYRGYTSASSFSAAIAPWISGTGDNSLPIVFTSSQNPVYTTPGVPGQVTLSWNAPGHRVMIVIGSPTGTQWTGASPAAGSIQTGVWVTDGMQFYLLDSDTHAVLSKVTENVIVEDIITFYADPNPIPVNLRGAKGQTTLTWSAPAHAHLLITWNGVPLTGTLASSGSMQTSNTVTDGSLFLLMDQDTGASLAAVSVGMQLEHGRWTPPVHRTPPVKPGS